MRRIITTVALAVALTTTPATAADRGMGKGPGPCMAVATAAEQAIMWPESRGWPTADNPRSTAFGCGQLLIATRRAHYPDRCPLHTLDVDCQMTGMRRYITARYGNAPAALAHRRKHGTY